MTHKIDLEMVGGGPVPTKRRCYCPSPYQRKSHTGTVFLVEMITRSKKLPLIYDYFVRRLYLQFTIACD